MLKCLVLVAMVPMVLSSPTLLMHAQTASPNASEGARSQQKWNNVPPLNKSATKFSAKTL